MSSPAVPKKPIAWPEIPCEADDSLSALKGMTRRELYRSVQVAREDRWRSLVLAYEEDQDDFYNAWRWLNEHPIFYRCYREFHESGLSEDRGVLDGCIEVRPVKVNPKTEQISEDSSKNTKLEFWVEVFPRSMDPAVGHHLHDYECDAGGDTYEVAIVKVAKEIYDRHGNDRATLDREWKQ